MKITKTLCDVCGKEIIVRRWEDNPSKLYIDITTNSGQNPLGDLPEKPGYQRAQLSFEDVCESCSRTIAHDLYNSISGIRDL